jgi:ketosteroid isomerase-like protein
VFQRAFSAFATGDMETLGQVFDERCVWHYPGRNRLSGDHVGRDATFAMFGKEFELSGGTLRPEFHDALANDEHVVALLHTTAQSDVGTLDQDLALVFHIGDGKITEAWTMWTDPDAADVFWGQAP